MADQEHLAKLRAGTKIWNEWRQANPWVQPNFIKANLSETNLSGFDLWGANFHNACLCRVNLIEGSLAGAYLSGADLSGADLSGADLRKAIFNGANLRRANLREANLNRADLREANLSETNLSDTLLIGSQLMGSNLTSALLTGCCIQNWNIDELTQLNNVKCEYIYLKSKDLRDNGYGVAEHYPSYRNIILVPSKDFQEQMYLLTDRRPSDPNTIFAPGEFVKLFQKALETVDLIFADGIDWKAFFLSFQELRSQYDDDDISIQAIEKKSGEAFVIRLEVSPEVDKAAIESRAKELYERDRELLEVQYRERLYAKEREIEIYKQQSTDMLEIVKLQASRPITVEAKAMAESQSNSNTFSTDLRGANVANFANQVNDNARQQANQNIYTSPEKQSLAEAAAEIQNLLKRLAQINPTATESDQKAFVTAAIPATLRQRAVGALQSGGKAAIAEFLDNPYVNVAIAIIEGWQDAGPQG